MKKLLVLFFIFQFQSIAYAETTQAQALESTLKQIIQPAFADFHTKAQALQQTAKQFTQQTNAENLENVRNAWKALSLSWNQVRLYRFGPLVGKDLTPVAYYFDSSLLKGKDFSKAIHQDIRLVIKQAEMDTEKLVQALAKKNFKVQGLNALEILLFDEAYPLNVYQENAHLATYLLAHAKVLTQRAQLLNEKWHEEKYINLLLGEAKNAEIKFFNALWDSFTFTQKRRLNYLFKKDKAFPHRLETWRSQFTKQNLSAWVQALKTSFQTKSKTGYYAVLDASGYATGEFFISQLDKLQETIDTLPHSLSETLQTEPERVKQIEAALSTAMETYARDVLGILEVDLGFNFNDGD